MLKLVNISYIILQQRECKRIYFYYYINENFMFWLQLMMISRCKKKIFDNTINKHFYQNFEKITIFYSILIFNNTEVKTCIEISL